jgi:hypothetical protein
VIVRPDTVVRLAPHGLPAFLDLEVSTSPGPHANRPRSARSRLRTTGGPAGDAHCGWQAPPLQVAPDAQSVFDVQLVLQAPMPQM